MLFHAISCLFAGLHAMSEAGFGAFCCRKASRQLGLLDLEHVRRDCIDGRLQIRGAGGFQCLEDRLGHGSQVYWAFETWKMAAKRLLRTGFKPI